MEKKPYTSLEHSIRNIMTESVGAIGTDKFTKTGNSFFRAFHAEPKKGDDHPNGNAVRAARNVSKERTSTTMQEEEQLDELVTKIDPEIKLKLKNFVEPPTVPTPEIKPVTPDIREPDVTPLPVNPPAETPKPKTPGVETPEAPKKTPGTGEPESKPKGQIKTDGGSAPSGKEKSGIRPKGENAPNTKTTDAPTTKKTKTPKFPIISFPLAVNPTSGPFGGTHVRTFMHSPEERMESTEADVIRRSIENVARPGGKNRITKQAELKAKIINENNRKVNIVRDAIKQKKSGQNPLVDMKPKLKGLELDEGKRLNSLAKTTGLIGAGGGVAYETGAVSKSKERTDDPSKKGKDQTDIFGLSNKEYGGVDAAADLASMVPGLGIPASIYSAARDYQRGEYTDMALDLASAIPGVGTIIKGYKNVQHLPRLARFATKLGDPSTWKAAKIFGKTTPARTAVGGAIENVGNRATQAITGAEFGDLAYQLKTQAVDPIQKMKQSGEWEQLSPEQKQKAEPYSTMGGALKQTGKEYLKDLDKDVLQPAKETLKNLSLVSPAGAATPEKTSLPARVASGKSDLQTGAPSGKGDLPMPLDALQKKKPKGPSIEVFGGPTSSSPGKSYGKVYLNQK